MENNLSSHSHCWVATLVIQQFLTHEFMIAKRDRVQKQPIKRESSSHVSGAEKLKYSSRHGPHVQKRSSNKYGFGAGREPTILACQVSAIRTESSMYILKKMAQVWQFLKPWGAPKSWWVYRYKWI